MADDLTTKVPKTMVLVTVPDKPPIQMGISETMDVIDLAEELKNGYLAAKADGTINFWDIAHFRNVPGKLIKAVEGIELVDDELMDIDLSEGDEIVTAVSEKFGITSEKAKAKINHAIKAIIHIKAIIFD